MLVVKMLGWRLIVSKGLNLTPMSLASFLWDIGKQISPDVKRSVPSGAILFAYRNFIEN